MQNKETIENDPSKEKITYTSQANEGEGMVVYDGHVPNSYSNHRNNKDKYA